MNQDICPFVVVKKQTVAHDLGFPHEYLGLDVRVTKLPNSDDVMCKL